MIIISISGIVGIGIYILVNQKIIDKIKYTRTKGSGSFLALNDSIMVIFNREEE